MSWARYHADPARIAQRPAVDRRLASRTHWIAAITSDAGPDDPMTRLALLALAAAMPRGAPGQTGTRITLAALASRAALAERTVRDRVTWAARYGWLRIDGPRTRRVYVATIPHDVRHTVPDRAAPMRHTVPVAGRAMRHDVPDIVPMRRRRRCTACGRQMPRSTCAHHTICRTCWDAGARPTRTMLTDPGT